VAVNNPRKRDDDPLWYRVTLWNGLGDTVAQYVDKGDYVVVQGERLTISTWVDQQGNPRATLELTASSVDFSANRRGEGDAPDNTPEEEDIPF
jgi:single-strand DNA-binding protein